MRCIYIHEKTKRWFEATAATAHAVLREPRTEKLKLPVARCIARSRERFLGMNVVFFLQSVGLDLNPKPISKLLWVSTPRQRHFEALPYRHHLYS